MTQTKVFEKFNRYPWQEDKIFQAGLDSILNKMSPSEQDPQDTQLLQEAQLMKAKHFYFSRFQQNFDLEAYLEYEQEKLEEKKNVQQQEQFQRLEDYDYENDLDYTNGLPNIIQGWLEQQSDGLWDKERLDLEFSKAKAFYYAARVEKVDLNAYLNYKSKKEEANKPACPFANLWMNKVKVGPVDQINGSAFVITEKPAGSGAQTITFSSPKSQNVFSVHRLHDLKAAIQDADTDTAITALFVTATVADSSNPFEINERIETNDTKIVSSGLAYNETSKIVSGSELRQISLNTLSTAYYDLVQHLLEKRQKLAVTFSNGHIPLNAAYLVLCLGFMRVITEHSLIHFKLELSHAPIPPLLLLVMARARTNATKPLPQGLELYLVLSAPDYSKLRGPEILRLGLADVFVPEAKLSEAFDTAKKMAVCPAPDTNSAIQLALAIHHTYAGPNRLTVWEQDIANTFGQAASFEDLQHRLQALNTTWSNTILAHWSTLPPTLLNVIFRAVQESAHKSPQEILDLEQKLNCKWRQTEDYKVWLRNKTEWVDDNVDFYFEELVMPTGEAVVYQAPQEVEDVAAVCPVTGQKSTGARCPITGASVCPVTGAKEVEEAKCPYIQAQKEVCPVSEQKTTEEGCPFTKNKGEENAINA